MKNIFKSFILIIISVIALTIHNADYSYAYSISEITTAQDKKASLNNLTSNFYKNRDVLQIPIILQYISDLNVLEKKNYNSQITGFLVGVIHQGNRKLVPEWKKLPISSMTKNVINRSVVIEPSIEKILNENTIAPDLFALDFYWGYFGATYDKRCIAIIINTQNNTTLNLVLRTAAKNSLNANRKKYKVVDDMLNKQVSK